MKELFISCGRNYKNCLTQLFNVLGILFLSFLLGCSALGTQAKASFVQLKTTVVRDYEEADLSLSYITEAVENRMNNLGIGDIISVIEKKSLMPILQGEIEHALELVISNYQAFAEKLEEAITVCAFGLCLAVAFLVLLFLLGMAVSFFVSDIIVRQRAERTKLGQLLKEMLLRFLGFLAAAVICFVLYYFLPEYWKIFLILFPFLMIFMTLSASWLAVRKQGISFGSVVNWKNYFSLLIADILMLAVSGLIGWILFKVFNVVVAAAMVLSLVIVTLAALDLSVTGCADAARKQLSAKTPEKAGEEPSEKSEKSGEESEAEAPVKIEEKSTAEIPVGTAAENTVEAPAGEKEALPGQTEENASENTQ